MISEAAGQAFRALLARGGRVVLTTHLNPDGDAIGSQVALARALRRLGFEVRIVNPDPAPRALRFLEDRDVPFELYDPPHHDPLLAQAEQIVLLDNSAPDRLGRMEMVLRERADRVLCIDHHPTRATPWGQNILDQAACATAEIVYELVRPEVPAVDAELAEPLFVGIATDTGFFRFNSATARAFGIAAELVRAGVEPARCYRQIYERNSAAYTRLLGHALAGLRLDADGAVAWVSITREEVARYGAEDEDTSEMTTPLLAIEGVRIAILFRELADRRVKASLRSKGELDVRRLAAEFGGGGHRNASGIVLEGSLDEVARRVVARATALVRGAA